MNCMNITIVRHRVEPTPGHTLAFAGLGAWIFPVGMMSEAPLVFVNPTRPFCAVAPGSSPSI
jgi:hypothetical protein